MISVAPKCSNSSSSDGATEESSNKTKVPFGYSRKDVILIGVGVTVIGIGLKSGLEYLGVDPLQARNVVQLVLVLGLTIGWILTYLFRVSNKEMTYAQQLRNYEMKVTEHFELRNGSIKEWFPKKPILRALTPALRNLFVYPVKIDGENIYISLGGSTPSDASAIVFSGMPRPGMTATNVNVDEVRMVVIEVGSGGFGFTRSNELINGKAAIIGFLLLLF
ncbi:hypothetical protein Hanom_Chr15g01343531 [Helianthus anomalus]